MELKQLSIFVENKKGRLEEITGILAKKQIHIRAVSIADTTDYGILRLIVNKPDEAMAALKDNGVTVSLTSVIAIAIEDTPGALYGAIKLLSENNINVDYMYAFLNPTDNAACVILRVEDIEKASEVLKNGGVHLMELDEVNKL
ncbi:MAG: hypothetical protein IJ944_01440 [Clostridia bacterium]|nr:hypothetical protein [Clostridia bacterium]